MSEWAAVPTSSLEGDLTISVDSATKLITIIGTGMWSLQQFEQHFFDLRDHVARLRGARLPIRVLVDLTSASVQSAEIAQAITSETKRTFRPGDHVAIVLTSSLAKIQMRRVVAIETHELFTVLEDARTWLDHWDAGRSTSPSAAAPLRR